MLSKEKKTLERRGEMHIAIAGNIGSGKSTLTKLLAKHYGWEPRFEAVEDNPYLEDYFRDIHRWSFNLEVYFLKERFRDLIAISQTLSERDYETYMELFDQMISMVRLPDLMIYLRASVPHLVNNIQQRGRDYEQTIQLEYLQNLNERYDDFIYNKYQGSVMTVEKDNLDFVHRPKDLAQIIDRIDATLFGLFSNPSSITSKP